MKISIPLFLVFLSVAIADAGIKRDNTVVPSVKTRRQTFNVTKRETETVVKTRETVPIKPIVTRDTNVTVRDTVVTTRDINDEKLQREDDTIDKREVVSNITKKHVDVNTRDVVKPGVVTVTDKTKKDTNLVVNKPVTTRDVVEPVKTVRETEVIKTRDTAMPVVTDSTKRETVSNITKKHDDVNVRDTANTITTRDIVETRDTEILKTVGDTNVVNTITTRDIVETRDTEVVKTVRDDNVVKTVRNTNVVKPETIPFPAISVRDVVEPVVHKPITTRDVKPALTVIDVDQPVVKTVRDTEVVRETIPTISARDTEVPVEITKLVVRDVDEPDVDKSVRDVDEPDVDKSVRDVDEPFNDTRETIEVVRDVVDPVGPKVTKRDTAVVSDTVTTREVVDPEKTF